MSRNRRRSASSTCSSRRLRTERRQRERPLKKPEIDTDYLLHMLQEFLAIPSPSGFTDRVVMRACAELEALGVTYELTRRGAIRADLPGRLHSPDRAIVSHRDTLGAMVKRLKENGRLELVPVGHWSARFAEGARVTVFSDNHVWRGSILPVKASGHTFNEEIDTLPVGWEYVELRPDVFAESRTELERLGFNVGDFVAVDPGYEMTDTGFINSRYLDNKAGAAVMFAAMKAIKDSELELPIDCHMLFTISEEVGSGASAVLHGD